MALLPPVMSHPSIISRFNTHEEIDGEESDGGEDVLELPRPPSRQSLLRELGRPAMVFHLNMRDHNPYDPRNMIRYGAPLLRCSRRRACPACSLTACSPGESPCPACLNGDPDYCLHRAPCEQWVPSQKTDFHNKQQTYLPPGIASTHSSQHSAPPLSNPLRDLLGAPAGPPVRVDLQGESSPATLSVLPQPPPHHVLPTISAAQTSTPGEAPVRGYCQEIQASPIHEQPLLSDLVLQQRPLRPLLSPPPRQDGGAASSPIDDILSGGVVRGTLGAISRLPKKNPPPYSTDQPIQPDLPPPQPSAQAAAGHKNVTFNVADTVSQGQNVSQGSLPMSICQSLPSSSPSSRFPSYPIMHTTDVIPRDRIATNRHPSTLSYSTTLDSSTTSYRGGGERRGEERQPPPTPSLASSLGLAVSPVSQPGGNPPPSNPHQVVPSPSSPLAQSHPHRDVQYSQLMGSAPPPPEVLPSFHFLTSRTSGGTQLDRPHPTAAHYQQPTPAGAAAITPHYRPRPVVPLPSHGCHNRPHSDDLQRQPPSYPTPPPPPDYSVPISLLIDRIQELQVRRPSSSSDLPRTRPVQLPSPKFTSEGQITGLEFFRWLSIFSSTVDKLRLNHAACHAELTVNKFILPQELRTIASESPDLQSALLRIQARFPPKSSLWPELHREISSVPHCTTNKDKMEKAGKLISTLTLMDSWFPENRGITREDFLFVTYRIEGQHEGSLSLLRDVVEVDRLFNLPPHDPQHRSYTRSLLLRLEKLRSLWAELQAALDIASKKPIVPAVSSFSTQPRQGGKPRVEGKEKKNNGGSGGKPPPKKEPPKSAPPSSSGNPRSTKPQPGCMICRSPGLKSEEPAALKPHRTWMCPSLVLIRSRTAPTPNKLCSQCCAEKRDGEVHRTDCHITHPKASDGTILNIDQSCPLHSCKEKGYIHKKLCTSCGPHLPPPKPKNIQSFAFRVKSKRTEVQRCAFMTEVVNLVGRNGNNLKCKIQYDSLGGGNFCSPLPAGFNHGEENRFTEPFSLNTITGSSEYCLPMALLMIDTPLAGKFWVDFMITDFPDGDYLELDEQTRKRCGIHPYTEEQFQQCGARLILGVGSAPQFPEPLPTPPTLSNQYPGLTLWKSRLTGQVLFQGELPPSSRQITSFFTLPAELDDHQKEEVDELPPFPPSSLPVSPLPSASLQ